MAKVIKIGNSKGVRLSSKDWAKIDADIGDEVEFSGLRKLKHRLDKKKAIAALKSIAEMDGTLANIDVEKWMEERRQKQAERDKRLNDIRRL